MKKIDFFIGPCVLESPELIKTVADKLSALQEKWKNEITVYFKGSFDKANRSAFDSYRGPGLEQGLKWLEEVKKNYGLPTITDFHLPDQAMAVAGVVDVLQVPAFLCRQTDMIYAGAMACKKYNRILKVKKGQFLSPEETLNIVEKAGQILGKDKIYLTERGSSFGYNNLVVDMCSFNIMKSYGVKVIHDATHSMQRPGGLGKQTGGKRKHLLPLAKAAIAAGADGIFMEAHPNPSKALSDAATQVPLDKIDLIVEDLVRLKQVVDGLKTKDWDLE